MSASHFSGPLVSDNGFEGSLSSNSLNIGSGGALSFVKKGTVAIDLASISAGAILEASVTISGLVAGDSVIMNPPAALAAGLGVVGCFVSASDTLKLRIFNSTASPVDEASATWQYLIIR